MHDKLHTLVLVYLVATAVPAGLLLMTMGVQAVAGSRPGQTRRADASARATSGQDGLQLHNSRAKGPVRARAVMVLAGLWQRNRVVAHEAMKFGAVGAFNTVLDFAVLNLLVFGLGAPALRSKVLSTVVAATSSYLMNRYWTFGQRERQGVRREYVLFFGLNTVGLGISLVVLAIVRYGLDRDGALWLNAANVIGIGLSTLFRFWGYRRFVWTAPDAAEEGDVVAVAAYDVAQHGGSS